MPDYPLAPAGFTGQRAHDHNAHDHNSEAHNTHDHHSGQSAPRIDADGVIEGEFTAEAEDWTGKLSGFYCRKCRTELLTGKFPCPGCGFEFCLPTVPLPVVKRLRPSWMAAMTAERWSEDQLRLLSAPRRPR